MDAIVAYLIKDKVIGGGRPETAEWEWHLIRTYSR